MVNIPVRSFAWTSQDADSGDSRGDSWANGCLLGFDLETTGIDPCQDVPVSAGLVYVQGGRTVSVDHFLIDPGRDIPPQAVAVHGITTARAASEGVALEAGISHVIAVRCSEYIKMKNSRLQGITGVSDLFRSVSHAQING